MLRRRSAIRRKVLGCAGLVMKDLLALLAAVGMMVCVLAALRGTVWEKRGNVECMDRLRRIGEGVRGYAADHGGRLPVGVWSDLISDVGGIAVTPMSMRGRWWMGEKESEFIGVFDLSIPTIREVLGERIKDENTWRCPRQREEPADSNDYRLTVNFVDDSRGFRPGYRYMFTADMQLVVESENEDVRWWGERAMAGEMLLRNVGGLRLEDLQRPASTVLAHDAAMQFHSEEQLELMNIGGGSQLEMKANFVFADGHAELRVFRGRSGFLNQFHDPTSLQGHESELIELGGSSPTKEVRP